MENKKWKDKEPDGVWPVMLTPYKEDRSIDYNSLEALIDWYEKNGVDGLFSVCQSSEMFFLSLKERLEIAAFVKKHARVPVIASGHISYNPRDQVEELNAIADTGVDAVVLITNRQAGEGDDSDCWLKGLEYILSNLPDSIPLGLYECPYPYKRLISDKELEYCAKSERFHFLKDTSCDIERIRKRIELLSGTKLKLFNANTATLLESYRYGAAGFSGVMANFHPELYVWLHHNWLEYPEKAELLQSGLTLCSQIEKQCYPVNAKVYLSGEGLPISGICRSKNYSEMSPLYHNEIKQLRILTRWMKEYILQQ